MVLHEKTLDMARVFSVAGDLADPGIAEHVTFESVTRRGYLPS